MMRARERAESALGEHMAAHGKDALDDPSDCVTAIESAGLMVVDREQLKRVLTTSRRQTHRARARDNDPYWKRMHDALMRDFQAVYRREAGLRRAVVVLADSRGPDGLVCNDELHERARAIRAEARARRKKDQT